MLKVQEIKDLIKEIDQSSIEEFTFEHEGSKLKIKKKSPVETAGVITPVQQPAAAAVPQPQPVVAVQQTAGQVESVPVNSESVGAETAHTNEANLHKITSPMVGTFYHSSAPDAEPYVTAGSKVSKDSIVCIVEAMKLFNEIEAEVDGEVVEVLVKNGQLVEFGQPLFLVKPE